MGFVTVFPASLANLIVLPPTFVATPKVNPSIKPIDIPLAAALFLIF